MSKWSRREGGGAVTNLPLWLNTRGLGFRPPRPKGRGLANRKSSHLSFNCVVLAGRRSTWSQVSFEGAFSGREYFRMTNVDQTHADLVKAGNRTLDLARQLANIITTSDVPRAHWPEVLAHLADLFEPLEEGLDHLKG